jgi:thioredoxin-related protein
MIMIICARIFLQAQVANTNEKMLGNPVTGNIQGEDSGIKWVENLDWEQIKEKAKKENKYIFVDCYTTWCGPCKKMDKDVFSKKDVGAFFNDKFVTVRIQMDATEKDPEPVKTRYKDAARLEKEYFVFAYPTQLFFNQKGELVEKITGYQEKDKFVSIARASLKPGRMKYEDPYKEFLALKDKYQKGIKEYQRFPFMIATANQTGHTEFGKDLVNDFRQYLLTLSNKELLKRDYIEFINKYGSVSNKNSTNNLSRIFFIDGKKVDAIMEKKNYSMFALRNMIQRGYVTEFLNGVKGKEANASAPWDSLYSDIATQFTKEIAEQSILLAKITYFDSFNSYQGDPRTVSYFIEFTKKYGVEALFLNPESRNMYINNFAYKYFSVRDGADLNDTRYISILLGKAVDYTREEAKMGLRCHPDWRFMDTYAEMLYKVGEYEKAIKNEKEAIGIYLHCGGGTKDDKIYQEMVKDLSKMQNGGVDFSGSWKLNAEKSQFNNTPNAPAAGSKLVVEQKDGTITFQRNDRPKESLKIDSIAFIDISDAQSKTKVSIKPTPDQQGLIETRIYTYPEGTTSVVATKKTRAWTLSADKKTLTIQDHIETTREGLTFDMLLVYDRQ